MTDFCARIVYVCLFRVATSNCCGKLTHADICQCGVDFNTYRYFRRITRAAHYPHRSIFARKGKKLSTGYPHWQITRTENKRKSWFKVPPYLTKLDRQAIELFAWPWIDSTYKSRRLKKILPSSCQFYTSLICPVNYSMHLCLDLLECTAAERDLVHRSLKCVIF